ncbi:hypothetical protein AZE42_12324 [Rhizopogon vesiculosus]|uniref:Uncharacterized protein n=1 Tax=Rhizopogon vesiculosus TaxID=180088 RepID=A0A1J8QIT8_9AGAM|nr:hypothetical protein AZE42_12324 [Rhizopogon vesiculosus]
MHTRKLSLERKKSVLNWQDAELLGPNSVHITELEMGMEWVGRKRTPVEVEDAEMADPEPIPECTEQEQEHITEKALRAEQAWCCFQKGLNGTQAAWAIKKYRGYRMLPESIMRDFDAVSQP